MLSFFDQFICPTSSKRQLLSVHVKSQIEKVDSDVMSTEIADAPRPALKEITVEDLQLFRSTLMVGEAPIPVEPLETFVKCHWSL